MAKSTGNLNTPLSNESYPSLPGIGASSCKYYSIVPNSLVVYTVKPKHDKRGCLMPEPPTKTLQIAVQLPSGQTQDVKLAWPSNGVTHIRAHYLHYRVKVTTRAGGGPELYELDPIPGDPVLAQINSQQTPDPFARYDAMKPSDTSREINADYAISEAKKRMTRLRNKITAALDRDLLNNDYDETKMTKVGDVGANLRFQGYDQTGEATGDELVVENPIDVGLAKMEMAVGNTVGLVGNSKGFKNVSKIIKHAVSPHDQEWADWITNPMTKFLPSTAVVPVKTWLRAIVPSAIMLGMLMVLKRTLKNVKVQPLGTSQARIATLNQEGQRTDLTGARPGNSGSVVSGILGVTESLENRIRR